MSQQVNWAGALCIKKKARKLPEARHLSWVELCQPTSSRQIKGNRGAVDAICDWFTGLQCSAESSSESSPSLFVHGPSGVWKSSAVVLCGSEHGFNVVHTCSDVQRTPQKLDAILREVSMSDGSGVLLLDEFESFIKETSSLKWLSRHLRSDHAKVPVVIVCNAVDRCFHPIRDLSTTVEFQPYTRDQIYATLLRLSKRVGEFCHLPPMDCFFISTMCSGNVCQTVNQVQFLYYGTKPDNPKRQKKRQKLRRKVQTKCAQDSAVKMWSTSHRATSVDCFVNDLSVLESVSGMDREFMTGLGSNLAREYPLYFHNSTTTTLEVVASCAENVSAADWGLVSQEQSEDRMYDSENASQWSDDNINFMGCTCTALRHLRNREKNTVLIPRKSVKRVFKY